MKKVIIIGGGFAGLAAAQRLAYSGYRKELNIILIDRSGYFNFLPMLPDVIARDIPVRYLSFDLGILGKSLGFELIKDNVIGLDLNSRIVFTTSASLNYGYLLIASGSETNFYGNEQIKKYAYKLDDTQDAQKIRRALIENDYDSYIVSGGGYTGIEIASNLRIYLNKMGKNKRVIIVERAPGILGPLPAWMKAHVANNLKKLEIELYVNTVIEGIEGNRVLLSTKEELNPAMLIWAAGVRTADFIQVLENEKNPQGRIKVDEYLRLNDNCFVAGDAGYFTWGGNALRMAVQFAITQGDCAARNIIRSKKGAGLVKYKPFDFGYIIPLADNDSCGSILGVDMKGVVPTLLHFFMCVLRSYGLKKRVQLSLAIAKNLLQGGE